MVKTSGKKLLQKENTPLEDSAAIIERWEDEIEPRLLINVPRLLQ